MKIYQLHEYSGQWEDYHDYIIGSYLRKERAEEEKIRAESKEKELIEHHQRCMRCPFLEFENAFVGIDELLSKYAGYCQEAKLECSDYGVDCVNYRYHGDDATFEVVEVEVEE